LPNFVPRADILKNHLVPSSEMDCLIFSAFVTFISDETYEPLFRVNLSILQQRKDSALMIVCQMLMLYIKTLRHYVQLTYNYLAFTSANHAIRHREEL